MVKAAQEMCENSAVLHFKYQSKNILVEVILSLIFIIIALMFFAISKHSWMQSYFFFYIKHIVQQLNIKNEEYCVMDGENCEKSMKNIT